MELRNRIREVCEARVGRELLPEELDECVLWFRQFADLLCEWARDEALQAQLGLTAEEPYSPAPGREG